MAITQTDLDNLDAAIATGALRVEFNGRMVIYQHTDELIRARAHVLAVLTGAVAATPKSRGGTYRYMFTTARGD